MAKSKKRKQRAKPSFDTIQQEQSNYPSVTTRISQDIGFNPYLDIKKYWGSLGIVPAQIPVQIFDIIDHLILTDPYVNKYHQSTVALANSGHNLTIGASSAQQAQKAIDESNRLAERCFPMGGGVFGLSSGCFSQLARTGATCVEWAPDKWLSCVQAAFLVPVKTLVFTYMEDSMGYRLCQRQIGIGALERIGIVPLNTAQTVYYNACMRDGSPYTIPPVISAIESCGIHKDIIDKIALWMNKLSSLGVMLAEVEPPPRFPGETQENYDRKSQVYLDKIAKSVGQNMASGLGVAYNNVKFTFANTQAGASGAHDLLQMVLQGVFAGLARDPVMFGWNNGKSDSFVKIIYEELQQSLKFYQAGVAKVIEKGHQLNLALLGQGDCTVSVNFRPTRSLDAFRDSEAEYMDSKKILEQMMSLPPAISVSEARKKLGYDEIPIINDNTFIAEFSNDNNEYKMLSKDSKIYSFPVQIDQKKKDSYVGSLGAVLSEANNEGFQAFSGWLSLQMKLSREVIVQEGVNIYLNRLEDSVKEGDIRQLATKEVTKLWADAQFDEKLFAKTDIKAEKSSKKGDELAAIAFLASIVEPYLVKNFMSRSEWRLERTRNAVSKLYDQYGLDNPSADKINAFKASVSNFMGAISQEAAVDMGDITQSRAKTWGSVFALRDNGVEKYVVVGPMDNRKCAFCYAMLGKVYSVPIEVSNINNLVTSGNPKMGSMAEFITKKYSLAQLQEMTGEEVQESGFGAPPYHDNCRDRLEAI